MKTYIYRIFKSMFPDDGISAKAMCVMNTFVLDIFNDLMHRSVASLNADSSTTTTMSLKHVERAVAELLERDATELAKHAEFEGNSAVHRYNATFASAATMSRCERAAISFPIGRVHRELKEHSQCAVTSDAAVYLTAVLQYVCAELLEAAKTKTQQPRPSKRITPRDIQLGVRNDTELCALILRLAPNVTLPSWPSGVGASRKRKSAPSNRSRNRNRELVAFALALLVALVVVIVWFNQKF
jgi:histone H2A